MKLGFFSPPVVRKTSLLKTGQITSYVAGDDGANQIGVAKSYTVLNTGQYAGTTNVVINSKTDAHTNACVLDNNTGLMWSQRVAGSVGSSSDGKIPWTTTGAGATAEGIFPYVSAANAANLAGYSDWRIPNVIELMSIMNLEGAIDAAFPSYPTSDSTWSSTTVKNATTAAGVINALNGMPSNATKTLNKFCLLVRGGNP